MTMNPSSFFLKEELTDQDFLLPPLFFFEDEKCLDVVGCN
jgi:hypothetical protein